MTPDPDPLDGIRDLLTPAELADLETALAQAQADAAAMTPEEFARLDRKAAQEEALVAEIKRKLGRS
jgi:hypothetical protein